MKCLLGYTNGRRQNLLTQKNLSKLYLERFLLLFFSVVLLDFGYDAFKSFGLIHR